MGGRVLVIDDSFIVLAYVEEVLKEAGHAVVVAEDWAEVRNIFRHQDSFHVVLVDVNFPGMKPGDLLAKSLRIHPKTQRAKIVYFSAESETFLKKLTIDSGMDGYIVKGKSNDEFVQAVESLMDPSMRSGSAVTVEESSVPSKAPAAAKPRASWWKAE